MNRAAETKDRIAKLQEWLRQNHLAGVFVPRTDFWQGEEVMPCDERLKWLTGFTGSAGMALVLQDRAALFIDGRYTIQAANEVAGTGIEVCHFIDRAWPEWLGSKGQGQKFAVDSKLVTVGWANRVAAQLEKKGAQLEKLESNPIDSIWMDQPAPAFTQVEVFPLELAGESSVDKRRRLAEELKKAGHDGAFITDPTGIAWLFNIRAQDYQHTPVALSVAWLKNDGSALWFTDAARAAPDVLKHIGQGVTIQSPSYFVQYSGIWSGQKVLVDEATGASWLYDKLASAGAQVKVDRCVTALPKACKNKTEIEGMRAAHRRDGVAMVKFLHWFAADVAPGHSGLRESDVMERLQQSRATNDYRGPSFGTICGFGGNGAIVHYHTTPESDKPISGDNLLLLDSGGQYVDGTTDITRTLAVGTPSAEQKLHYTLVLKGHIALASAKFPEGTVGSQLDTLARAPLWTHGLNYDHGTGHGVGHYLSVHEGPQGISSRASTVALKPGMVLSNEPGYYLADQYGIRIETLVTVRESQPGIDDRPFLEFETLTQAPYERSLIDTALLSAKEKHWIDDYHAGVFAKIGPSLDEASHAWLKQACAPLT